MSATNANLIPRTEEFLAERGLEDTPENWYAATIALTGARKQEKRAPILSLFGDVLPFEDLEEWAVDTRRFLRIARAEFRLTKGSLWERVAEAST